MKIQLKNIEDRPLNTKLESFLIETETDLSHIEKAEWKEEDLTLNVDFNNLRYNTVETFSELVNLLNDNIYDTAEGSREVQINVEDIEKVLDTLRFNIATMAHVYSDDIDGLDPVPNANRIEKFKPYRDEDY